MAIAEAVLEALAERVVVDDPLTYQDGKEAQAVYYQLRHESERALAECGKDEAGAQTILLALHAYEHNQIDEPAFLGAIAQSEPPATDRSDNIEATLRAGIAFRLAFAAYFYHRWSAATDPAANRRLISSFLFQLAELNRYLADYQGLPQLARTPAQTPVSLAQLRLQL